MATAMVPAFLGISAPAVAKPAVSPLTLPGSAVVGASVTFTTNDEDKDGDTLVDVKVNTHGGGTAAEITNFFGHFDDGTVHGPFPLFTFSGFTAADLTPGAVIIQITPNGNDTWRFNYSITLDFADGTNFVFTMNNRSLNQDHIVLSDQFTLTPPAQVTVPSVVGLDNISASGVLESAGLHATTLGTTSDTLCEHNERDVASQTPGAGAVVAPGTLVGLRLWTEPKSCP